MSEIKIQYDKIYSEIPKLRSLVSSNIIDYCNTQHQDMQSQLRGVDGAANAQLLEALEANRLKTLEAAGTLEKLLQFIFDSAKQIEINEQHMARAMNAGGGQRILPTVQQ